MWQRALKTAMVADVTVNALLAGRIDTDMALPGTALPYVVLSRISSNHLRHMGGPSPLVTHNVQLDVYASTPASRNSVIAAIRILFHATKGTLGTDSLDVRDLAITNEIDGVVTPSDGQHKGPYRTTMEFTMSHVEATS